MDNLTHSLTGLLLSRAGLERKIPRATLLCVVTANVPDLDIIVGTENYLTYHRHITHALPAIPVMAAVGVLLTWALDWMWRRRGGEPGPPRNFKRDWLAALIPAASHPMLDMLNSYGVRLWLPYSAEWSSWDLLFIIDVILWAILLTAAFGPLFWGWIRPSTDRSRRRFVTAWAGLATFVAYVGLNAYWHEQARESLAMQTYDGLPAQRAEVFPAPVGPLDWIGYVETEQAVWSGPVRIGQLDDWAQNVGRKYQPPPDERALEAAWRSEIGRLYSDFARYPFVWVEPNGSGVKVTLGDFRFLRFGQAGLTCVVELDRAYRVVLERFDM